jgi:hypothetical protein
MVAARRREVPGGASVLRVRPGSCFPRPVGAHAAIFSGRLPWSPGKSDPPQRVEPQERATVEANRLIPTDSATPGGKDLRCAVFIAVVARARMSE